MTAAEYARHRGVSKMAVSKALRFRLKERSAECPNGSVTIDAQGRRSIDPALADVEWEDRRKNVSWQSAGRAAAASVAPMGPGALPPGAVPALATSIAIKEAAAARAMLARAAMAEHDLARRQGATIAKAAALADLEAACAIVKACVLGVPTKFVQRRPDLAGAVSLLRELLDEALEELANRKWSA